MSRKQQQPYGTRDEAGGLHPGCWGAAAVAWPAVGDVCSRGVTGSDPQEAGVPPWASVPECLICGAVVTKLVLRGPWGLHTLAVQLVLSPSKCPHLTSPQISQYTNTHDGPCGRSKEKSSVPPPVFL